MAEYRVKKPPAFAVHPGVLMREILDEHVRLSITEAARRMQISRQSLHAVLSGESAVTADMALRFGKLVSGAAELYVNMQTSYDLWHARHRLATTLEKIVPATAE